MTEYPEAVARRCSVKKVFLEISQNSPENTCARVSLFLIKLQTGGFSKNAFSYRRPLVAASEYLYMVSVNTVTKDIELDHIHKIRKDLWLWLDWTVPLRLLRIIFRRLIMQRFRSNSSEMFDKISVLKILQNSQENACAGVSVISY